MSNKSDEVIIEQAQSVINGVIERHFEVIVMRWFKPLLKKAFPFGPAATEREKQLWHEQVEKTVVQLGRQTLIVLLTCAVFAQCVTAKPTMLEFYIIPVIKEDGTTAFIIAPKRKRWSWIHHRHTNKRLKKESVNDQ
jgi:hypothetical protein